MSKSFIAIKKAIGLYDILDFGKYKGCRVDSIVEQDPGYLDYTRIHFGMKYTQEVKEKMEEVAIAKTTAANIKSKRFNNAYSKLGIATLFDDNWNTEEYDYDDPITLEDVPF